MHWAISSLYNVTFCGAECSVVDGNLDLAEQKLNIAIDRHCAVELSLPHWWESQQGQNAMLEAEKMNAESYNISL